MNVPDSLPPPEDLYVDPRNPSKELADQIQDLCESYRETVSRYEILGALEAVRWTLLSNWTA